MKKECREKSMEHKIIGCVLTILIGLPIAGYTEIGDVLRGATVFNKNCVICHGSNAEGSGPLAPSLPVKPANLTDCRLTAEDPIEVLEGIIRHGGAFTGLSSIMPAWGKKLTDQEISDVAAYVKTLCTTENWLTGDLNFPRPLITGKAFPEQEIVVGGKFAQGDTDTSSTSLAFEYRFDGLTQIEVSNSVARNHTQNDSANTGIGDTAISIKRVLAYSDERNTLVAVGVKLQFPTGDEDRKLGSGEMIWQPSLRAGFRHGEVVTQIDTRVTIPAETSNINASVRYNLALGYILQPDPRLELTPMIEFTNETRINGPNDGRTVSTLVPQFRLKWLQYSYGFGVQIPFSNKAVDIRPLFDVTYEYLLF